eukprot:523850_1
MFQFSICQAIIHALWLSVLLHNTSFISTFGIIIIIKTHIRRHRIISSSIINQHKSNQSQTYMQMYNYHLNNLNEDMLFRWDMYCIWDIYIPNWIKNLQILQEVIINLFCYINIQFIFLFIAHTSNESPYNLWNTKTITNENYIKRKINIYLLLLCQKIIYQAEKYRNFYMQYNEYCSNCSLLINCFTMVQYMLNICYKLHH